MPATLNPDNYDLWLDPGFADAAGVKDVEALRRGSMRCYPVSARVNGVANDDAECAAPAEVAQEQARLF